MLGFNICELKPRRLLLNDRLAELAINGMPHEQAPILLAAKLAYSNACILSNSVFVGAI